MDWLITQNLIVDHHWIESGIANAVAYGWRQGDKQWQAKCPGVTAYKLKVTKPNGDVELWWSNHVFTETIRRSLELDGSIIA